MQLRDHEIRWEKRIILNYLFQTARCLQGLWVSRDAGKADRAASQMPQVSSSRRVPR